MSKKYNGWTNRATWAVHLWITNEEYLYKFAWNHAQAGNWNPEGLRDWFEGACWGNGPMRDDCEPLADVNWVEVLEALSEE